MAYEVRMNSATLFKNDRKSKEGDPNAKGEANIDGVMYWVSAWTNRDKNGNPYQKLSFTAKDDRQAQAKPDQRMDANNRTSMDAQKPAPVVDDFDSEIPF